MQPETALVAWKDQDRRGLFRVCGTMGRMTKRPPSEREKQTAAGILLAERRAEQRLGNADAKHATKPKRLTGRAAKGLER